MIAETDLIIKNDNIYHIDVNKDNVSTTIILVGDPDRVEKVSQYFDNITHKSQHREFVVHSGYYKGKYLTAMSTGIGCDNIDIVINELDAIFNIDLKTREIKKDLTSLNLIRLGTCGTIREDIPVDSIIVSDYGLGFDNLLSFYENGDKFYSDIKNLKFIYPIKSLKQAFNPYIVECDSTLKEIFSDYHHGITATFSGFYGPQGRNLRIKNNCPFKPHSSICKCGCADYSIVDALTQIRKDDLNVVNFEMETSALYGLAKLSGHKALTLCTVVANRVTKEFTKDSELAVDNLIKTFLDKIINHI